MEIIGGTFIDDLLCLTIPIAHSIHFSSPLSSPVVLGIAGTAKNTGKTTALNALLSEADARHVQVAVTSIGYDGEAIDSVTGLPKPRIVLHPGTIATTSRSCLPKTGWEVITSTGWSTPLGQVLVVRCVEAGPIVLAGPSTRRELAAVVEQMCGLGPALTLIDGALNRLTPMSVASGLVLATGAARSTDLPMLARETAAIESILGLPLFDPTSASAGVELAHAFPSLADIDGAVANLGNGETFLRMSKPISARVLKAFAHDNRLRRSVRHMVWSDPVLLLIADNPRETLDALEECRSSGLILSVAQPLPLAAVTINPFLPRFDGHGYVADTIPAEDLRRSIGKAVRSPVVDVNVDGAHVLWDTLAGMRRQTPAL